MFCNSLETCVILEGLPEFKLQKREASCLLMEARLLTQQYSVIKKSLCTRLLQYRKLQLILKVSPASLQTFIDKPNCVLEDRVQYSTVHIPNAFCDGHLQIINCVGTVLYCNSQVDRDFLITLCMHKMMWR